MSFNIIWYLRPINEDFKFANAKIMVMVDASGVIQHGTTPEPGIIYQIHAMGAKIEDRYVELADCGTRLQNVDKEVIETLQLL